MSETRVDSRDADEDGREVRRLEAEIASKRERVITSFDELRERVRQATSLGHWASAHPVAWLGVGVFLGMLVGYGVRRSRRQAT